jgi:hypothetical protein
MDADVSPSKLQLLTTKDGYATKTNEMLDNATPSSITVSVPAPTNVYTAPTNVYRAGKTLKQSVSEAEVCSNITQIINVLFASLAMESKLTKTDAEDADRVKAPEAKEVAFDSDFDPTSGIFAECEDVEDETIDMWARAYKDMMTARKVRKVREQLAINMTEVTFKPVEPKVTSSEKINLARRQSHSKLKEKTKRVSFDDEFEMKSGFTLIATNNDERRSPRKKKDIDLDFEVVKIKDVFGI